MFCFDCPEARAYYKKKFGGGSAVDDGYCIEWDGNTDGREALDFGGLTFYKVSNIVLDVTKLTDAIIFSKATGMSTMIERSASDFMVASVDGLSVVVDTANSLPCIISGASGAYTDEGGVITIPYDGTYFLAYESACVRRIAKPAAV